MRVVSIFSEPTLLHQYSPDESKTKVICKMKRDFFDEILRFTPPKCVYEMRFAILFNLQFSVCPFRTRVISRFL